MSKTKYLLCCLCFLSLANVVSQQPKIDSLTNALKKVTTDIEKPQIFNAIANEYKSSNPKKMIEFAHKALLLSQKTKNTLEEATAQINLGNANILLSNYSKALSHFADAQLLLEKQIQNQNTTPKNIKSALARVYGSIGIVFSEQSSYAKSLEYQLKALKIYEENNDKTKCAILYNNIGVIYKSLDDDNKALYYFNQCLTIQKQRKDENIGTTLTNIGTVYLNQNNYAKAQSYFVKAEQLFKRYEDTRSIGELHNNWGQFYQKQKAYSKAIAHYNLAIVAFNSLEDKFGIADSYYYLGEIFTAQGQYSEALKATQQSLQFAKESEAIEQVEIAEKQLSTIYDKINNKDESLKHFKLYAIARDSVAIDENIRNSIRAEMNFEFEKKQNLQKKEQEKQQLLYEQQSKQHRMQIVFAVLLAILILGIFFLFYNRLQLKKTLTLQKELAEYEQKALHLQMNPHFVFNCLGSISSFIVQNGTDSAIKYLSKFSKLMRLTLEYSKESLIPIDKEVESLQNYLELEQLRFNHKFDFTIKKSIEIEDDMALPPLLLQPFVENAIMHGLIPKKEKGTISIHFTIDDETMICTIEDNGIGFEKSKEMKENLVSVHKSMALDITKKRLEMISKKAKVAIKELKNEAGEILGTQVVLNLPIQYLEK